MKTSTLLTFLGGAAIGAAIALLFKQHNFLLFMVLVYS